LAHPKAHNQTTTEQATLTSMHKPPKQHRGGAENKFAGFHFGEVEHGTNEHMIKLTAPTMNASTELMNPGHLSSAIKSERRQQA
jgi:hypothetical protein